MDANSTPSRNRAELVEVSREELLRQRAALLDRIDPDVRTELEGIDFLLGDTAASASPETSPDGDVQDGLVEAERYARTGAASKPPHELLVVLMAEYDRRGAELADSRKVNAQLREGLAQAEAELVELRADLDDQARRGPEQCCDEACNGGACETCRCCAAGWCVMGADGVPEATDLAGWMEVAAEHNPIVAAWKADRVELERLRAAAPVAGYPTAALTDAHRLNELADDMERVLALTEEAERVALTRERKADLVDARRLVKIASARLARLAAQASEGETRTEWAEKYYDEWTGQVWDREDAARYFVGKRRQPGYTLHTRTVHVGPWTPATPSTDTSPTWEGR